MEDEHHDYDEREQVVDSVSTAIRLTFHPEAEVERRTLTAAGHIAVMGVPYGLSKVEVVFGDDVIATWRYGVKQ